MNGTPGVPLNPQPNTTLMFFPGPSAITGSMTVNITFTLYTDSSASTIAAGTAPITVSYPITVAAAVPSYSEHP